VATLLSCALLGSLLAPAVTSPPLALRAAPPGGRLRPAEADADLDRLLQERGRPYLEARARLEANPSLAAPAVATRLRRVPAPTAAEERRLLALLAGMARPEDLEVFAAQLRRDVAASHQRSPGERDESRAAAPWRAILREQGAAAVPVLTALVGDRELGSDLRALVLGDLVAVTPAEQLAPLVDLVGGGALELRQALRVALARRAQSSAGRSRRAADRGRRRDRPQRALPQGRRSSACARRSATARRGVHGAGDRLGGSTTPRPSWSGSRRCEPSSPAPPTRSCRPA
jgi:hypothetical protein